MFDRAVLARRIHRLEDHQDPPLVLRIQPLLQLGERLDAKRENLLSARLILGFEVAGIVGIEFLQPELVAAGDAIRSTKLPTSLDPLRQAQSFEGHRASSLSSVWLFRSRTVLASQSGLAQARPVNPARVSRLMVAP